MTTLTPLPSEASRRESRVRLRRSLALQASCLAVFICFRFAQVASFAFGIHGHPNRNLDVSSQLPSSAHIHRSQRSGHDRQHRDGYLVPTAPHVFHGQYGLSTRLTSCQLSSQNNDNNGNKNGKNDGIDQYSFEQFLRNQEKRKRDQIDQQAEEENNKRRRRESLLDWMSTTNEQSPKVQPIWIDEDDDANEISPSVNDLIANDDELQGNDDEGYFSENIDELGPEELQEMLLLIEEIEASKEEKWDEQSMEEMKELRQSLENRVEAFLSEKDKNNFDDDDDDSNDDDGGKSETRSMKEWQLVRSMSSQIKEASENDGDKLTVLGDRIDSWKDYLEMEKEFRNRSGLTAEPPLPFPWNDRDTSTSDVDDDAIEDESNEESNDESGKRKRMNVDAMDAMEKLARKKSSLRSLSIKKDLDDMRPKLEAMDYDDSDMDEEADSNLDSVDVASLIGAVKSRGEKVKPKPKPSLPSQLPTPSKPPSEPIEIVLSNTSTPEEKPMEENPKDKKVDGPPKPPKSEFFAKTIDDDIEPADPSEISNKLGTLEEQKLQAMFRRAGATTNEEKEKIRQDWLRFQEFESSKRSQSGMDLIGSEGADGGIVDEANLDAAKLKPIGPRPKRRKSSNERDTGDRPPLAGDSIPDWIKEQKKATMASFRTDESGATFDPLSDAIWDTDDVYDEESMSSDESSTDTDQETDISEESDEEYQAALRLMEKVNSESDQELFVDEENEAARRLAEKVKSELRKDTYSSAVKNAGNDTEQRLTEKDKGESDQRSGSIGNGKEVSQNSYSASSGESDTLKSVGDDDDDDPFLLSPMRPGGGAEKSGPIITTSAGSFRSSKGAPKPDVNSDGYFQDPFFNLELDANELDKMFAPKTEHDVLATSELSDDSEPYTNFGAIFRLEGVLLDTTGFHSAVWGQIAEDMNLRQPSIVEIQRAIVTPPEAVVRDVFYWTYDKSEQKKIVDKYEKTVNMVFARWYANVKKDAPSDQFESRSNTTGEPIDERPDETDEMSQLNMIKESWTKTADIFGYKSPSSETLVRYSMMPLDFLIRTAFGWSSDATMIDRIANTYQDILRASSMGKEADVHVRPFPNGEETESLSEYDEENENEMLKLQFAAWSDIAEEIGVDTPEVNEVLAALTINDPYIAIVDVLGWAESGWSEVDAIAHMFTERLAELIAERYPNSGSNVESEHIDQDISGGEGEYADNSLGIYIGPPKQENQVDNILEDQIKAWNYTASMHSFTPPSIDQVRQTADMDAKQAVRQLLAWTYNFNDDQISQISATYEEALGKSIGERSASNSRSTSDNQPTTPPEELFVKLGSVCDWVESLRNVGVQCSLLSSLNQDQVDKLLSHYDMGHLFPRKMRVTKTDGYTSLSQQMLGGSLRMERGPNKCAVFDAAPTATKAASEVGMKSVAVVGPYPRYELLSADTTTASLDMLDATDLRRLFIKRRDNEPLSDDLDLMPPKGPIVTTKFWGE